MKKLKTLFIYIYIIITLTIYVTAIKQGDYTTGSSSTWEYIFNANDTKKHAHMGKTSITYKLSSNIPSNWNAVINDSVKALSPYLTASLTTGSAVCTFESSSNLGSTVIGYIPGSYHLVDTSTNHVTGFIIQLNSTRFDATKTLYATHEVCHGIGLAHITTANSSILMDSYVGSSVSASDIKGIKAVTDSCTSSGHGNFQYTNVVAQFDHKKVCGVCGAYTYEDHFFGNYSQLSDTQHSQTCNFCPCIYKTDHSWNVPLSFSDTVHSKQCKSCAKTIYESHVPGTTIYKYDINTHYKKCTLCNRNLYEIHTFTIKNESTLQHSKTCSKCTDKYYESHIWSTTTPIKCITTGCGRLK